MKRLLFLLFLLLVTATYSHAQVPVLGGSCPASGQNALSPAGQPMVCTGNPLVWTAVAGGGGGGSGAGVGAGAGPLAPGLTAISPYCPAANTFNCIQSPGNTQVNNSAAWTNSSTTVTAFTYFQGASGAVSANVATYTTSAILPVPTSWTAGDSVTVSGFTGGDSFFNQTCTLSAITATSVSCPLTHANASSTTFGTVTNTTKGPFVAADAIPTNSKIAWGADNANTALGGCNNLNNHSAVVELTTTHRTIASFISSTQIALNANPDNSSVSSGHGCFIWGTPDDAASTTADSLAGSQSSCGVIEYESGNYLWTTPHHYENPQACANLPGQWPNGYFPTPFGNTYYSLGFEVRGRGPGNTSFWFPPDFPESGSCNHGLYDVASFQSCLQVPALGYFHDFALTSGSLHGIPSNVALLNVGIGLLENVMCVEMGFSNSNNVGLLISLQAQVKQVQFTACGAHSVYVGPSTGLGNGSIYPWPSATGFRIAADSGSTDSFAVGPQANFICTSCIMGMGIDSTSNATIQNFGGTLWLANTVTGNLQLRSNAIGYNAVANGSILHARDTIFNVGSPASFANWGIRCTVPCTNYLDNNQLFGNGTGGNSYQDVSGSQLFDTGQPNTFSGPTSIGGTVYGNNSVVGIVPLIALGTGATFKQSVFCGHAAGSTTCPAMTPTFGDQFVVIVACNPSGCSQTAPPTDGVVGDTFVSKGTCTTGSGETFFMYEADGLTGASSAVTLNYSNGYDAFVLEYQNIATAGFDKFACANGNSTTPSSGATATTTAANEILIGYVGCSVNQSFTPGGVQDAGAGYTQRASGSFNSFDFEEDQNVTATGAFVANGSFGVGCNWSSLITTFKTGQPVNLQIGAGWGSTATMSAEAGTDQRHFNFMITNSGTGQAQGTATIIYTFPKPFLQTAGSCSARQINGTNPTLQFFTTNLNTTSATFTAQAAPTASDTEVIVVDCS
jgi:hypothetical protein